MSRISAFLLKPFRNDLNFRMIKKSGGKSLKTLLLILELSETKTSPENQAILKAMAFFEVL
jgi:hypothetical protein